MVDNLETSSMLAIVVQTISKPQFLDHNSRANMRGEGKIKIS